VKRASPLAAAACLLQGLRLLNRPGIRPFVLLPLAINLLVYLSVGWYVGSKTLAFSDRLLQQLPGWLQWLEFPLWLLLGLTALLVTVYSFTLVANLIGAPFNGLLAERVEVALTGQEQTRTEPRRSRLTEAGRDFLNELRKLRYFAIRALLLLLITLIPGVNLLAAPLWGLFAAWMMAVEYLDYPMANNAVDFRQQLVEHRKRPLTLLGFGTTALLLNLVPLLNLLAMPAAVAGATALWVEQLRPDRDSPASVEP